MLALGATSALSVEDGVLNAEMTGRYQNIFFFKIDFKPMKRTFYPIKQNELHTLSHWSRKSKPKSASNKVI